MTKISQCKIKSDKRVSSSNIYQITKILDYNMICEISKQQSKGKLG